MLRIGVDLGGTKIEAAAVAPDGQIVVRERVPTPRDDYDGTIAAVVRLVGRLEGDLGQTMTVGVGMPGTISPATGLVKNANSVWLNGRPLDRDLSEQLARPVRLANDANCFALSEARGGAAAGVPVVFGVIIGTGTGGGIVVNGRVVAGRNAVAGEWGHNPLPWPRPGEWPGAVCYCGLRGCIETFLSGPGLARDYASVTGDERTSIDIVERAAGGDPAAEASLQRYEDRCARALASVINVLDPDIIVLGGGMSNLARLYTNVPRLWLQYVFSDRVDTMLVAPRFGAASGVRGAAWLWEDAGQ
jgi:fructokinase